MPTGVAPLMAPVAKICPIASPVGDAAVTLFDPGVTRVAVTDMMGWVRVKVTLAGKVVPLKAALKAITFPEIDTIVVWVPVRNIPTPRPVVSATVMVFPLFASTDAVKSVPH